MGKTGDAAYHAVLTSDEGEDPSVTNETGEEDLTQYLQGVTIKEGLLTETNDKRSFRTTTAYLGEANSNRRAITGQSANPSFTHYLTKADPSIQQHIQKLQPSSPTDDPTDDPNDSKSSIPPSSAPSSNSLLDRSSSESSPFDGFDPRRLIDPEEKVTVRFGGGQPIESSGKVTVTTPLGPIDFHVVPVNPPPSSFAFTRWIARGFNSTTPMTFFARGDVAVPIIRRRGHPWMLSSPPEKAIAAGNHMAEVRLRRLHRRFGHPSRPSTSQAPLQSRSGAKALTVSDSPSETLGSALSNYDIVVDIMHPDGNKPALHVVDSATALKAARFLEDISAKSTWEALRLCWIDVYQGPPDWIVADAGRNSTAAKFRHKAKAMSIDVKAIPVKNHHGDAIKSVNDTAGPDGPVSTLLLVVLGAYPLERPTTPLHRPTPSRDVPRPFSQGRRGRQEARRKAKSRRRSRHAQRPWRNSRSDRGSARGAKRGDGPDHIDVSTSAGGTCVIDVHRPRRSRSTVVEPSPQEDSGDDEEINERDPGGRRGHSQDRQLHRRRRNPSTKRWDHGGGRWPSWPKRQASERALAVKLRNAGILFTTPGAPPPRSPTGKGDVDDLPHRAALDFILFDPVEQEGVRTSRPRIINKVGDKTT
ncbi:hypothetical protein QIS74_06611 [Colletotrichum tabaci]|uniref:Integrase catalytic domain-containing protein n=1 Tax=Colletotrichum tabaci TaxID=1209068 RepID=A0AAV9TD41_9PEZI